jgi:hypothetical protein
VFENRVLRRIFGMKKKRLEKAAKRGASQLRVVLFEKI